MAQSYLSRIEHIWMVLSVDEARGEGVVTVQRGFSMMPLVASDEERLAAIRLQARKLATETGRTLRLVKFTTRVEIEEIGSS